jgi:hypothetical protein
MTESLHLNDLKSCSKREDRLLMLSRMYSLTYPDLFFVVISYANHLEGRMVEQKLAKPSR